MKSAHPLKTVRAAAVLAVVLLVGALGSAPVRADSAQTKKELDAARAELDRLEGQIAGEVATINSLQADLQVLVDQIDHVKSRIALTQFRIVKKEVEIDEAQSALDGTREQLNHRAWVAYVYGPGSSLEFLLGSTSLSDLTQRLEIVNSAVGSDQDLIIQIQQEQNKLRARQAELESLETGLREDQANLIKQERSLSETLAQEQGVLAQLEANKSAADSLVNDLAVKYKQQKEAEERAAELARLAQQQQNKGGAIGGVFFACPVGGGIYSDDFGAPRNVGGYHPHAGNDIFASMGTPIHAPFPGSAARSDNGLGGISVKVFGAAGWVYNAHLSAVGQLGPVQTGDVIGYVGDSGNAKGGAPHNHFEWHPNVIPPNPWKSPYGYTVIGSAIDPYPYLNSVC